MLFDQFADTLVLARVQRAITNAGIGNVALFLLAAASLALAVDYAWMIYLHYRMVRLLSHLCCTIYPTE